MGAIGLWLATKTGWQFARFIPWILLILALVLGFFVVKWNIDGYWANMEKLAQRNATLTTQVEQGKVANTNLRQSNALLLKQLQEERRLDKLFREGEAEERRLADEELAKLRANDLKRFDPAEQERAIKEQQLNPDEALARENARTKCIMDNWGDPDKCN